MNKVQIKLGNHEVLVDEDQVKLVLKKQELVKQIVAWDKDSRNSVECVKLTNKIISLNRRIRKNVIFL